MAAIEQRLGRARTNGALQDRRKHQAGEWLEQAVRERLLAEFTGDAAIATAMQQAQADVAGGRALPVPCAGAAGDAEATVIRLAGDGDFDAIAAITNHYIRTTAIHFGYEDVTAAELRTQWRDKTDDLYPWLVTTDHDGDVIGYAKAGPLARARAAYQWSTGPASTPTRAGAGIGLGAPLYRRLLDVLRAQGFCAAIGGIALPNAASVGLHERLGFVHTGTVPQAGRKFDRWHDLGFWHLRLQPGSPAPTAPQTPARAFSFMRELP